MYLRALVGGTIRAFDYSDVGWGTSGRGRGRSGRDKGKERAVGFEGLINWWG